MKNHLEKNKISINYIIQKYNINTFSKHLIIKCANKIVNEWDLVKFDLVDWRNKIVYKIKTIEKKDDEIYANMHHQKNKFEEIKKSINMEDSDYKMILVYLDQNTNPLSSYKVTKFNVKQNWKK